MSNSWATIDLDYSALVNNVNIVKQHATDAKILAMVKANAYGHGLKKIAVALQDHVQAFGVARLSEVIELRDAGICLPIVLMPGVISARELEQAELLQADLVVHQSFQIDLLRNLKSEINVWLKIDIGMGRLGFSVNEFELALNELQVNTKIKSIKLMTHFSDSGDLEKNKTKQQTEIFLQSTRHLTLEKSLSNSAAILSLPDAHEDWVRPGLMLYGASPIRGQSAESLGLQPVMNFSSVIIAIRQLQAGDSIGYDSIFSCDRAMTVAIVAVGYGDSYPRHIKSNTPVLIQGKRCPIVGRISMDMMTVDVSSLSSVMIGERVILWGCGLPVDDIADFAYTSAYELLTQILPRN